jgi:uncharacterized spore protein YtfJ
VALRDVIEALGDSISIRRVYGEPIDRDGVTVIPAATVLGGGGGGADAATADVPDPQGGGFGYGLFAWPAGAWEITADGARWRPAYEPVLIAGITAIVLTKLLRSRG